MSNIKLKMRVNRYAATFEQKDWKSLMKYRPGLGPNER